MAARSGLPLPNITARMQTFNHAHSKRGFAERRQGSIHINYTCLERGVNSHAWLHFSIFMWDWRVQRHYDVHIMSMSLCVTVGAFHALIAWLTLGRTGENNCSETNNHSIKWRAHTNQLLLFFWHPACVAKYIVIEDKKKLIIWFCNELEKEDKRKIQKFFPENILYCK